MSAERWAEQAMDVRMRSRENFALAGARWWRKRATRGADPIEAERMAQCMELLAEDIAECPEYYRLIPEGVTYWEWFQMRGEA
jgi:hypothetical protein